MWRASWPVRVRWAWNTPTRFTDGGEQIDESKGSSDNEQYYYQLAESIRSALEPEEQNRDRSSYPLWHAQEIGFLRHKVCDQAHRKRHSKQRSSAIHMPLLGINSLAAKIKSGQYRWFPYIASIFSPDKPVRLAFDSFSLMPRSRLAHPTADSGNSTTISCDMLVHTSVHIRRTHKLRVVPVRGWADLGWD
ncbi:hypothetical protein LY78DRAFT_168227 [Colletotrichum sublineola]|nr:hypothetical protein LY78DRAFT_168227 [Colletotrichum sublineola]